MMEEEKQNIGVIETESNKEESTIITRIKTKKKRKGLIISLSILGSLSVLIVAIIIVNQLTVYPFISLFRWMTGLGEEQGNIGPYAEQIEKVKEGPVAIVSTEGYPDAELTFYYPDDSKETHPVILYIHGGGWSVGSAKAVSSYAKLLASNGYIVANAEYALAPENPYPASTYQLVSALNYLYENADKYGIDNSKIFIGGNSAGAHLSSQLGALVSNPEYADEVGVEIVFPSECVKGLLLFNGVYNFDNAGDCKFPFFDRLLWSYTGVKDYKTYAKLDELSTLKHITPNYPTTFITVGDIDPLEPQTIEFIDKLQALGVDHTALLWSGTNSKLFHDYIYELDTEEAQKAYRAVVDFLTACSQ